MPVSPDYEWPSCWIRGEMSQRDIADDVVSQTVQDCKFRKIKERTFFGFDYICTHLAVGPKQDVEGPKVLKNGGIVAGGLSDEYATFCPAVDLHLTSIGEKSRLMIDAEFRDVEPPLLGSGE